MELLARDDKRSRILAAAIRIFADNGFHNSKVGDIAKEANVADGTIYLYFKNKDDILISLFEEALSLLINNMRAELKKAKGPLEKVQSFIRVHLSTVEQYQAVAEVMQVELRQSHKFMKEYVPEKYAEYLNIISDIILEGQKAGVVKKDIVPAVYKRALFGALDEISLHWVLTKRKRKSKYDLKDTANVLADIFIRGILGGEKVKERKKRGE